MILVSLLCTCAEAKVFPQNIINKAEASTSENEAPETRRKDDKTWIVGYLDKPKNLRPVQVAEQKPNEFQNKATLPIEVSSRLIPFSYLPKYRNEQSQVDEHLETLPFDTLNWC